MTSKSKKVFIIYQSSRKTILLESCLSHKDLYQCSLNLFQIKPDDWTKYDLILLEFDCLIKCSAQIISGDILELRKKNTFEELGYLSKNLDESQIDLHPFFEEDEKENDFNEEYGSGKEVSQNNEEERIAMISPEGFSFDMISDEERKYNEYNREDTEGDSSKDEEENEHIEDVDDSPNKENKGEIKIETDVKQLKSYSFHDREDLKNKLNHWGASQNLKFYFESQERKNLTTGVKVSTLYCSFKRKTKCEFYLEFRTDANDIYSLDSFHNFHNHSLLKYHDASAITPEIIEKIKELLPITKSYKYLTDTINKVFKKNFHFKTIYYQITKLGEIEYGKASEDAQFLISLLEKDAKERNGFYSAEFHENRLQNCCYMSLRMKTMFEYFNDVIIIDSTFKLNRFNLPFLDVTLINNLGKSVTGFFALLNNQKYESYLWALQKLRRQLTKMPIVIFSDDETALRNGTLFKDNFFINLAIKDVFPRATNYICSWHSEQNLKKKFYYLNKSKETEKKKLYELIKYLPYIQDEEDFLQDSKTILKSKLITKEQKNYLKEKFKESHLWVKAFMKKLFTCGMCSTSRIEAKHRVFKLYLNSNSKLCQIFKIFKQLESKEIFVFQDEIQRLTKKENEQYDESNVVKYFSDNYSAYALSKLKHQLIESINYKFEKVNNYW